MQHRTARILIAVATATALTIATGTAAAADQARTSLLFEWYPGDAPKTLYLADADGKHAREITRGVAPGTAHVHADWSPDGRTIAWEALDEDAATSTIWLSKADGTGSRKVAGCLRTPCSELSYPAFSPDGRSVLVVQFDGRPGAWGPSHLVSIDLASGTRKEIIRTADGTTAYYNPRWSPDGRSIAVEVQTYPDSAEEDISTSSVALVSVRSGTSKRLTPLPLFAGHPDFRPTDGLVVFDSHDLSAFQETTADSNLYTVRADGTGLRQLTHTRNVDGQRMGEPTWTPDGRGILATVGIPGTTDDGHRILFDAHLGTVTVPSGQVFDSGIGGANPRLQPGGHR